MSLSTKKMAVAPPPKHTIPPPKSFFFFYLPKSLPGAGFFFSGGRRAAWWDGERVQKPPAFPVPLRARAAALCAKQKKGEKSEKRGGKEEQSLF
jgi:hypothetical protein